MKKFAIFLLMMSVAGLRAVDAEEDEQPVSEAFKAIKAGLIAKPGDVTELMEIKEDAVKQIESLAAQGQNVQDALDYLDSRIGFDPQKKDVNAQRLKAAHDRIETAANKKQAAAVPATAVTN